MSMPEAKEHDARMARMMAADDKVTVRNVMPLVREAVAAAGDKAAVVAAGDETVRRFQGIPGLDSVLWRIVAAQGHLLAGDALHQPVVAIRLQGNKPFEVDHRTAARILRETLALYSYCNALIDTDGLVEQALVKRGFPVRVVVIPYEMRFDASQSCEGYTTILVFDTRDTATLFAGVPPK